MAVYGTGDEQVLSLDHAADTRVVPVRSELELRWSLPSLDEEDPRVVFLVPWTRDVPLDLSGRFARNGRVIQIGRESRLKRLFGVVEVDDDARRSPLADVLLGSPNPRSFKLRESRLTLELLWTSWLSAELGLETQGGIALDILMAWAALDARARLFAEAAAAAPRMRDELLRLLDRAVGPAGRVAWEAWEQGRGQGLLETAVLFEALASSKDGGVRMWIKVRAREDLGVTDEVALAEVPAALARAVGPALRIVEQKTNPANVRAIVRAAEQRVDDADVLAALAPSTRLPVAFEARLTALGEALAAASTAPSVEGVERAERLLHAVEGHALASQADSERHLERGLMAVRLLAWLATKPLERPRGAAPHDAVESLGSSYADEGGFVDWARRAARGAAMTAFGRGVQAVVEAADSARRALDRSFARALVAWYAAGKPAANVVPMERALDRVAARFLEEQPARRLLVLLMDGMAWAQAVELLDSLSQGRGWGPLAWQASGAGRIGEGFYPVVLAATPSITEISRAAFFAGKILPAGREEPTHKDPERFRDHPVIRRFFSGTEVPTLLLRSESHTRGGAASEAALRLVADADHRVVAVVVNAIDDALKGNPATRHPWDVDSIASLADLLEKARECGRAVLLASDHGHVPADLLESKGSPSAGGARWRPLAAPSDPVQDFEVAVPATLAWAPRGAWGVALMADDGGRWGSSTHAGEHGGATLAEIIAPCVLVGAEDLQGPVADGAADVGLALRAPYVPSWWHLAVTGALPPMPPATPATRPQRPQQLALPTMAEAAPPPPPPKRRATAPPPASASFVLAKSRVLEARAADVALRAKVAQAVELLMLRNGVVTAAAFASEMGVLQRRVGGLVAQLQEVLNVDGYEVLLFDGVAQQVRLDVGKLRLLFEVP